MASSMTLTASFFGGVKPAKATTRRSPLAVRASMDLEKAVAESSNTRRGLVLSAVGVAAASSVAKVALADNPKTGNKGAYYPVNPCDEPRILEFAKFAVSEYNKKNNAALVLEYVTSAESKAVGGYNYRIGIAAKDTRTGSLNYYVAVVVSKFEPISPELLSFDENPDYKNPPLGAYRPVNPCAPETLQIATFAVSEYNIKNKAALVLEYVTSADQAVVAGFKYRLVIAAKDTRTGSFNYYIAVVVSEAAPTLLKLISFEPLLN